MNVPRIRRVHILGNRNRIRYHLSLHSQRWTPKYEYNSATSSECRHSILDGLPKSSQAGSFSKYAFHCERLGSSRGFTRGCGGDYEQLMFWIPTKTDHTLRTPYLQPLFQPYSLLNEKRIQNTDTLLGYLCTSFYRGFRNNRLGQIFWIRKIFITRSTN